MRSTQHLGEEHGSATRYDVSVQPSFSVKPLERQSIVYLAVEQIRRMISSGAVRPGQKLPTERELAEMFAVSRPTIREAIRVLSFSGVLASKQGSGTFVTSDGLRLAHDLVLSLDVSKDADDDLMEIRLWLEVGASERAAAVITDKQVTKLKNIVDEFEAGPRTAERFVHQELAFHALIHEASGNAVLVSQMSAMRRLIEDRLRIAVEAFGVRQASLDEHRQIIAGMEARDPVAARRAMRLHLTLSRDQLHRALEQAAARAG